MSNHASFSIVDMKKDYIYIRDNGGANRSITNDADWVIEQLDRRFSIAGKRIFYIDTAGETDELVHENGTFRGFRPGGLSFMRGNLQ